MHQLLWAWILVAPPVLLLIDWMVGSKTTSFGVGRNPVEDRVAPAAYAR